MCGICGFTYKADAKIIKGMADAIFHRGPDEDGFYTDENISLGMRRLSIIDLKTGHQPIHNEDKSVWIVFNGEIYNFQELRSQLEAKAHRFYTDHSDTEVIAHLYEEHGLEFMHKLNGMFAIAIWDKKKKRLVLARDRMGVKPLFYTKVKNNVIFGSEIKAILAHPDYRRRINHEGLYHYFTFKNVPAPFTAFKDIYSILPGEILVFSGSKITKKRWWKVRFEENYKYDAAHVKSNIINLLEDSTRLRMISDVPFGAYLSGGVDSSSVVALMTRFSTRPIKTFSLGYEDELKNKEADIYYARKVSKVYGTHHHEYIMSYKELIGGIDDVIGAFDQPFSGTISTFFLTKLIKKHVKVAISGDGADELFGSYLSHRVARPISHYRRLLPKIKRGILSQNEKKLFLPCDMDFMKKLFEASSGDEVKWRYHLYQLKDPQKQDLISGEFKKNIKGVSTIALLKKHFARLTATGPLNRVLEMEWNTQLPDQVLAFVDFLSMAHSVEIRSPFLDYRLVEFVATIPDEMKIKEGNVKDILKKTVAPLLPQGITERPKEGFVLPIFDWMVDKLKCYSISVLAAKRLKKHDLLNQNEVDSILQAYYSGDKSKASVVWNLMMFQIWWEKYFG